MDVQVSVIAAARQSDLQALDALVSQGANINERDEQGWTALHWSAGRGDLETIRFLLDRHADPSLTGRDNRTPLMVARAAGRREAVEALAAAGKAIGLCSGSPESKRYCKGYYLADFARYPQWPDVPAANGSDNDQSAGNAIAYLHQDFTVTKSVWPGEQVILSDITPEWIRFCETELKFSAPPELL